MKYIVKPFRMAEAIFNGSSVHSRLWGEICGALDSISDEELIHGYENSKQKGKKSLANTINELINGRLVEMGWERQSKIFNGDKGDKSWTLDFAKEDVAIEVAFNHGEAIAWNLVKVVLSSEVNHVQKEIQTSVGVVITVTDGMKKAGNFDGAVGTFEKFQRYMDPLRHMLTVPLMVIGLERPETFNINPKTRMIEQTITMY